MTRILAIDLGKFKSVACIYDSRTGSARFRTVPTTPAAMHDLFVEIAPDRVVIEVCGIAGWVADLARSLDLEIQVVDTRHDAWRWNKVKRKTDRDDALKLARLSAANDVSTVHMPQRDVRQWRSLITYRHTLVDRRTAIKNTIRALVDVQGLRMAGGAKAWSSPGLAKLRGLARVIDECGPEDLWRGQLASELRALGQVNGLMADIEAALDRIAVADDRVARLKTIPGVGTRLAELVVASIDDPGRFGKGRELGAYAGLVPRQFDSGIMQRSGRITKQGPGLLRRLLVQIAWGMERRSARVKALFERLSRGQKNGRKKAAVAIARKILVWCWAMLRDGTTWRDVETNAT